ncbi:hypothetical protein AMTR_s00149p00078650 [Amborella trichopoda]|uniref:Uncharacterized protein n=1 Tax=Amborella trichopoda TaxID=13333 RepID=W1PQ22_AMBTC|nr:hypothetical protein AMTR_s00149p00078650 [Amborella trichopoda]
MIVTTPLHHPAYLTLILSAAFVLDTNRQAIDESEEPEEREDEKEESLIPKPDESYIDQLCDQVLGGRWGWASGGGGRWGMGEWRGGIRFTTLAHAGDGRVEGRNQIHHTRPRWGWASGGEESDSPHSLMLGMGEWRRRTLGDGQVEGRNQRPSSGVGESLGMGEWRGGIRFTILISSYVCYDSASPPHSFDSDPDDFYDSASPPHSSDSDPNDFY